jgi:hypothetical protein
MAAAPTLGRLPTEIWQGIVAHTQRVDQRTLLSASRFLRAVAHGALFRVVRLQFGAWEGLRPVETFPGIDGDGEDLDKLTASAASRTAQLTVRVVGDAEFAQAIKSLHVLCHQTEHNFESEGAMQSHSCVDQLLRVPQICKPWLQQSTPCRICRLFTGSETGLAFPSKWPTVSISPDNGTLCDPSPSPALATSCPDLRELRIPATHDTCSVPRHLELRQLRTLMILCQLHLDIAAGSRAGDQAAASRDAVQALIHANARLARLTLYGALLEFLTPGVFAHLVELEVWGPRRPHLDALACLLPHAVRLERLALVELARCAGIVPALRVLPPRLTALKIMTLDAVPDHVAADLVAVIRAQPYLSRLDLDLPQLQPGPLHAVLAAVSALPHIEALGIDMRALTDVRTASAKLPRTLVALHVQLRWDNAPLPDPMLRALAAMPALALLHLFSCHGADTMAAEELADELPTLERVGLGARLWDVERRPHLKVHEWTPKQIAMRSVETLGDAGEWYVRLAANMFVSTEPRVHRLLRFHDLLDGGG